MEESIYNLIPKEYNPEPKPPLYRSKYPPNIPPTGSTFCHSTTSKPGVHPHSFRSPTSQDSLLWDCKPILNTATDPPWATSNTIESHLLISSDAKGRERWEATSSRRFGTLAMTAVTRGLQFLQCTRSQCWV